MRPPAWLVVVFVGALAGLVFAGISTYDFVQHLDRQVHSIHCSFIPGASAEAGASGCQVAMMSPYSSVLRTTVWGGIPISLPAMAVFAFIGFCALDLLLSRRKHDPRATGFLALACALPAVTSIVMAIISLTKLGTACKLCVGIYIASALCVIGATVLWRQAARQHAAGGAAVGTSRDGSARLEVSVEHPPTTLGYLGGMFALGVAFVLVPVLLYVGAAPDHSKYIGTCDVLAKPADTYGVMVQLDKGGPNAAQAIEILDPLCPACRAFEARLDASGLRDRLDRKAILFPLDNTCNWMITESTHPGACTLSEAVLCAGPRAPDVIAWSFENQERIMAATRKDPAAAAQLVKQRFPELASCVGSAEAKSKVNKSLRWAVANNIRVLTPQLFVDNVKLCDEDVDLGLEYALNIMLERHAAGTLAPAALEAPAPAQPAHATPKPVDPKPGKPAAATPVTDSSPTGTAATGTSATATPSDTSTTGTSAPGTSGGAPSPGTSSTGTADGTSPTGTATDNPATGTSATDEPPTDSPADKPVTSPSDSPTAPATEGGAQ